MELPILAEAVEEMGRMLARQYPFFGVEVIGGSFMDREILLFSIGRGEKTLLYVAGHHALETVASAALLRFAAELCEAIAAGRRVYDVSAEYLLRHRRICILPLLNPDGAFLAGGGLEPTHPLYERLCGMNGGSADFSHWQANGRGVDLNHNYDAGFAAYKKIEAANGIFHGAPTRFSGEYPESEPETAALCGWIRAVRPRFSLTLHTQGEQIYAGGERTPRIERAVKTAAALTGYRPGKPEGSAAYGGMTDWMTGVMKLPCLTLECGEGENPLPISTLPGIYGHLRELLFRAPILFGTSRTVSGQ